MRAQAETMPDATEVATRPHTRRRINRTNDTEAEHYDGHAAVKVDAVSTPAPAAKPTATAHTPAPEPTPTAHANTKR